VTIIDAGLYAAACGLPVVPIFGVHIPEKVDGEQPEGWCLCSAGPNCKAPGKHPRYDLAPHGVHDATLNQADIALWPLDINIAAALGKVSAGQMVCDVDDTPTADLLTHPTVCLRDRSAVSITGKRGIHVWFVCRGDTSTYNIRRADGLKLGEVRGDGAYALLPPSRATTGKYYRWLGSRDGDYEMPPSSGTEESFPFVTDLFAAVEVELKDRQPDMPVDLPSGAIEERDIPEPILHDSRVTRYRQLLDGHMGPLNEPDRSGKLWAVAMCLMEAAHDIGYPISAEEIAGVVKKFDRTCLVDPKFAGRADGDNQYWAIAQRVLPGQNGQGAVPIAAQPVPSMVLTLPQTASGPQGIAATPTVQSNHFYDPADGCTYKQLMRSSKPVCNFKIQIIQEVDVNVGESEALRSLSVRCTLLSGRSVDLTLQSRHLESSRAFEKALEEMLDSAFIVQPGMYGDLKTAMRELSAADGWEHTQAIATTGWIEHGDRWLYVLPSSMGAIGKDGLDTSITFSREHLPTELRAGYDHLVGYGKFVRPALNDRERRQAAEAFYALIECAPLRVSIPVVLQVFAGPLVGRGVDSSPPLPHVMGKTGSCKSSFTRCALALMGYFGTGRKADGDDNNLIPVPWSGTPASQQAALYLGRQLTLLADDFKTSQMRSKGALSQLIQNYADRTGRSRARPDGSLSESKAARALLLSNGEDVWDIGASGAARTMVIDLLPDEINLTLLDKVQDAVKAGRLQLFGGTFIAWLAGQTDIMEGGAFSQLAERESVALATKFAGKVHLRLTASLSNLLAVGAVVERFLADTYGAKAAAWFRERIDQAMPSLVTGMEEQARDVEEASPLNSLLTVLREVLAAREACLFPAKPDELSLRFPLGVQSRTEVVGFWMSELPNKGIVPEPYVLLTGDLTYSWYAARLKREGETTGFVWKAFYKEALAAGGIRLNGVRAATSEDRDRKQRYGVGVPIAWLLDAEDWKITA
jgi:hypothetical protein